MNNTIFQFPIGTEVEFTLSKNRIFDNAVLKGVVVHYFRKPGQQTVLQNKEVKVYPVNLVHIKTKSGELRVDVGCIITKPTQAMINEINRLTEEAIKAKEKVVKKVSKPKVSHKFKLADSATIIKKIMLPYIASKNSKIFHDAKLSTVKRISAKNAVFFKSKAAAEASGRRHAK